MDLISRHMLMGSAGTSRVNELLSVYSNQTGVTAVSELTIPGGTLLPGDLLVVWNFSQNATSTIPSAVINTDFTVISNISSAGNPIFPQYGTRQTLSYKIATGSETQILGMTCNQSNALVLKVFRGNQPISAVVVNNVQSEIRIESGAINTITSGASLVPSLVLSAYGNWTNQPRNTPALSTNIGTYTSTGVEELTVTTGKDLITKIWNSTPENMFASCTLDPTKDQLQAFTTCYLNIL